MQPDFFHVGVAVPSLEPTHDAYCAASGVRFTGPRSLDLYILEGGVPVPRTIRFCYSTAGSPYVELIESAEFPWASAGLHHFGIWSDDVERDIAAVLAQGGELETRRVDAAGEPLGFVYVRLPGGLRIELVDIARKPVVEGSVGFNL